MREHSAWSLRESPEAEGSRRGEPAPLPFDARAVLALQRSAGNAATARLLQRQIFYKNSKYGYDGKRAGWQVHAEKSMVTDYNERFAQSLVTVPYDKLKLARAHIGAYDAIQGVIAEYLNGKRDGTSFDKFVEDFTAMLDRSSDEYSKIDVARRMLAKSLKSGDTDAIVDDANTLLSRLNNLTENLRAADKYLNSYIQEHPDLVFVETKPGEFSLNQHGKNLLAMGVDVWGAVPRTPEHGTRVVTSEGAIPIANMTPTSRPVVESYPAVKIQIKSKKVKEKLYGPTALQNWKKLPAPTAPPPTVPVATAPAPRYQDVRLVHVFADGTEVHEVYDTQTKANTYVQAKGGLVVQDLGPVWAPPPRYQTLGQLEVRTDGTEIVLAQDTQSGGLTWLWVLGTQVIQDLGPGWAPMPQLQNVT